MNQTKWVLRDLEEAIARGTAESRTRALWHTTDLLIAGRYCEEDVATFGEVIDRLADEIELVARAQLAQRMARIEGARFSGAGFLHMIKRAEGDSILAEHLGLRGDIPRQLFQQLIAKASNEV